jgi:hypothetical protein
VENIRDNDNVSSWPLSSQLSTKDDNLNVDYDFMMTVSWISCYILLFYAYHIYHVAVIGEVNFWTFWIFNFLQLAILKLS